MTEQEQMEEMKDIVHNLWDKLNQDAITTNDIIDALYNAGYRKLPEDSIVLSMEEFDTLKAENDKYVKDCIDYIATISKLENKVWEVEQQASKETAEKDFNAIIQALEERKDRVKAFYGVNESVGVDIAIRTIKELAKQYGVEIKE